MLLSSVIIGYIVFTNWFLSAKETTESIAEEMNRKIHTQINSFLYVPEQINESNHKIISNGILDLTEDELREYFFVGVLSSRNSEIYSFSYGTAKGEYYGARRNESDAIEIMRNNASTGGNSWYYSVNEDMKAGDLVVDAGKFDPRTRPWYKIVIDTGKPAFSPIYKHFIMDDLSISYGSPVLDKTGEIQGVLGIHMLLSDIDTYLEETVSKYNGYALIIEKESNNLVANSMGLGNLNVLNDGTLERIDIREIQNKDISQAYEQYLLDLDPHFFYGQKNGKHHVNVQEIHMDGLEWLVISAVPEDLLITPIIQNLRVTIILTVLALLFSFTIFYFITRKLLKPIDNLLKVSESFSSGDLTSRADIVRNDEIGSISASFNKVADKMEYLINNLEDRVKERTEKLSEVNITLEDNKNQLRLILDSSAEGIYGIDLNGNCSFCNLSCIELLGYTHEDELLGKNMHKQIHHSYADGRPMPIEECKIFQAFKGGEGMGADDEVFWKSDGTFFDVEYHSFPQIKDGETVGAVITFRDITLRKQRDEEIEYLSSKDVLTGLYNRRSFEDMRLMLDLPENLPLSVIFADINGLKMTNDIFGHGAGDDLIKKSAEILVESSRENDFVARVGGDEFIILLPETSRETADMIVVRIKEGFLDARIEAIKCSISLGLDTKTSPDQALEEIIANAENAMYKDKTMNRKSVNKEIIDTIIDTLHSKSPREKQHSLEVGVICKEFGQFLELAKLEINKLERTGYLHDIGKITLDEEILSKVSLTDEEFEKMQQHSVIGYRILNLFDDTLDIAEYVYSHHERWDGTGYPRGLKGEQIPLISRIISIVETYERVLNRGEASLEERELKAMNVIKEGGAKQFDPELAELFLKMLDGKNRP